MSKWKVTFEITHEVTREVDLDDDEIRDWREFIGRGCEDFTDQEVVHSMITKEVEFTADTLSDWQDNAPLPRDFELQYTDVSEVEEVAPDGR